MRANLDKFAFLATVIPMTLSGALPADGQYRKYVDRVSQRKLASRLGLSRATFTRRVSQFTAEVPSSCRKRPANPMLVLQRDRGFAVPNRYSYINMGERKTEYQLIEIATARIVERSPGRRRMDDHCLELNNKRGSIVYRVEARQLEADRYYTPSQEQLCADPGQGHFWDRNAQFGEGFKKIPEWIFHENLPLSDIARLVFVYYVFCGLLDDDPATGQVRGEVHPHQWKVAAALGISIRSVYTANRELAELGLIRVVHPKPTIEGGRYVRGPARIIYLPIRQLSSEEAAAERERFRQVVSRVRDQVAVARAVSLHSELLTSWTGREHHLRAFWNELRRQLLAAGIDRSVVRSLIPRPPS